MDSVHSSWYAWPTLLIALAVGALGVWLFCSQRWSRLLLLFGLMLLAMMEWLVASAGVSLCDGNAACVAWSRAAVTGVLVFVGAQYHFGLEVLRSCAVSGRWDGISVVISWAVLGLILQVHWATDALVSDGTAQLQPLGRVLEVWYLAITLLLLFRYWRAWQQLADAEHKLRLQAFMWAHCCCAAALVLLFSSLTASTSSVLGLLALLGFVVAIIWAVRRYPLADYSPAAVAEEVVAGMADALLVTDLEGRVQLANNASHRILGRDGQRLAGLRMAQIFGRPLNVAELASLARADEQHVTDLSYQADDISHPYQLKLAVRDVHDDAGQCTGYACLLQDVTASNQAWQAWQRSRDLDPLTGVSSWLAFEQVLEQAHEGWLLVLDIDRFGLINTDLGAASADQVLVLVTQRLQTILPDQAMLARRSADQFAAWLPACPEQALQACLQQLSVVMEAALKVERQVMYPTLSMGVSAYLQGAEGWLRQAELARQKAKKISGNSWLVFEEDGAADQAGRLQLEAELREAPYKNQLRLHYQPILNLESEAIVGFEALVRWQHPLRGIVSPAVFVELAEETGLIVPIGQWVIREACRQIAQWNQEFGPLYVSVNLSDKELAHPDLFTHLQLCMSQAAVPAGALKLELTERMAFADADGAQQQLNQLREMDIPLMIDDFGTGQSSLGRLQQMPVDTLKLDRSFLADWEGPEGHGGRQQTVVKTIIELAHELGIVVVVEGIEHEHQAYAMAALNCDYVQGFWYSKPVSAEQVPVLLQRFAPML